VFRDPARFSPSSFPGVYHEKGTRGVAIQLNCSSRSGDKRTAHSPECAVIKKGVATIRCRRSPENCRETSSSGNDNDDDGDDNDDEVDSIIKRRVFRESRDGESGRGFHAARSRTNFRETRTRASLPLQLFN